MLTKYPFKLNRIKSKPLQLNLFRASLSITEDLKLIVNFPRYAQGLSSVTLKVMLMILIAFSLLQVSFALGATVSDVREGEIDNEVSIIVDLKGEISKPFDITVTKGNKTIVNKWTLSSDRSFQYMPIDTYGIGTYEVLLTDVSRQNLEAIEKVVIREQAPSVELLSQGPFLNASGDRAIAFETVNASGISLSFFKVDNPPELFDKYYYHQELDSWSANRLRKNFSHVTDLNFKLPTSRPNKSQLHNIVVPDELTDGW